jgi:hypothetical protein
VGTLAPLHPQWSVWFMNDDHGFSWEFILPGLTNLSYPSVYYTVHFASVWSPRHWLNISINLELSCSGPFEIDKFTPSRPKHGPFDAAPLLLYSIAWLLYKVKRLMSPCFLAAQVYLPSNSCAAVSRLQNFAIRWFINETCQVNRSHVNPSFTRITIRWRLVAIDSELTRMHNW